MGRLNLAASERGLALLEFARPSFPPKRGPFAHASWGEAPEEMGLYTAQLEEYFDGRRRKFSFPLDLRGTDFQLRCWHALLEIPYGQIRTYGDIARQIGRPGAFRAVGMANHDNPIAIVVPCHRVVASNHSLCGYGGGLATKQFLLELEGLRVDGAGRVKTESSLFDQAVAS